MTIRTLFVVGLWLLTAAWLFVATPLAAQETGGNYALRFYGSGRDDVDRVKVLIDVSAEPINVGDSFTVEFWLKADQSDNDSPACSPGADNWIYGNIVLDRDVWGDGDYGDYGISIAGGRVAFGINNGAEGDGICGETAVTDGNWHHIAVTRDRGGALSIFVDGRLDGAGDGPTGDIGYRVGRATAYDNDGYLVIGAEKHDAGPAYPSYSGLIDELRISTNVRYTSSFVPPLSPFASDEATALLFHFDEGPAGPCTGAIVNSAGAAASGGICKYGGTSPAQGPVYVTDTPFDGDAAGLAADEAVAFDYGLEFDGEDDLVRLDAIAPARVLTIESWINPVAEQSSAHVIVNGDAQRGWMIKLEQGQAEFWLSTTQGWQSVRHPALLKGGRWHHLAVIYVGGRVRLFVDGVASPSVRVGALQAGSSLKLGGLAGESYFAGALDELRISRSVRYVSDFKPSTAPFAVDAATAGLWHFDEGNGQIVRDSTPAFNHGILGASGRLDSADPLWRSGVGAD